LAVSFNGNEYAVREAEIALMSENTIVTSIFADVFARLGKGAVLQLAEEWSFSAIKRFMVNPALVTQVQKLHPHNIPRVEVITRDNMEEIAKESASFRKRVRGEAISRLG
jgi:energy-converting hydrogenase A subunit R